MRRIRTLVMLSLRCRLWSGHKLHLTQSIHTSPTLSWKLPISQLLPVLQSSGDVLSMDVQIGFIMGFRPGSSNVQWRCSTCPPRRCGSGSHSLLVAGVIRRSRRVSFSYYLHRLMAFIGGHSGPRPSKRWRRWWRRRGIPMILFHRTRTAASHFVMFFPARRSRWSMVFRWILFRTEFLVNGVRVSRVVFMGSLSLLEAPQDRIA